MFTRSQALALIEEMGDSTLRDRAAEAWSLDAARLSLDEGEQVQQWCAELRSGAYPRGKGELFTQKSGGVFVPGFCCLGVLANGVLRTPLSRLRGGLLAMRRPDWMSARQERVFTDLNDHTDLSFAQMADIIEGLYLGERLTKRFYEVIFSWTYAGSTTIEATSAEEARAKFADERFAHLERAVGKDDEGIRKTISVKETQ